MRAELERARDRLGFMANRVYWFTSVGSTNDIAASLADAGAGEGTTVVAESQTSGRGRHGRVWHSPPGAGLYASVILRSADAQPLLTLASGVAIAEAVRACTGLPAEIKWPNDVMIGKRKLAGILAEAAAVSGRVQYVVLGFGVNLRRAAYPPELASRVTSIEAETNRAAERAVILAEIFARLHEGYGQLRALRFDAILNDWRRLAPSLPNALVEWDSPGGVVRGRAHDIDAEGALLVRVDARIERLVAGEVRWI